MQRAINASVPERGHFPHEMFINALLQGSLRDHQSLAAIMFRHHHKAI